MINFSILGSRQEEIEGPLPEYFEDLNLNQLIHVIDDRCGAYELDSFFYQIPKGIEEVLYRQEIMKEIYEKDMERCLREFYGEIVKAKEYDSHKELTEYPDSKAHWHLFGAYTYYRAIDKLVAFLEKKSTLGKGWEEFLNLCREMVKQKDYRQNRSRCVEAYQELKSIRYSIRVEGDHIGILSEVATEDYVGNLCEKFPQVATKVDQLYSILPGNQESTMLEKRIFKYLKKKNPKPFSEMHQYVKDCPEFFQEGLMKFHRELGFYLTFLTFQRDMEHYGYEFKFPEFTQGEFQVIGGYDLALAYKNHEEGIPTISNDYYYKGKERFIVVTGPNQGGKTTFGRSVAQLVYFSMMGLPVPATSAKLPLFAELLTHFSVEESAESGKGKLKEELVRLGSMMKETRENTFVVINELFTSAATYDAFYMGRRVMEHFLEHNSYGIYVTHIDKLAEETEQIISMVAMLKKDIDANHPTRTYKLERRLAEGKGYVDSIVEQYGLAYDEIIRRLKNV